MTATAIETGFKVTVSREALRAAVQAVAPAVARSSTLPVLKMLKLEARDGALTLTATNRDEWVAKTIPAEVGGDGGVVLVSADTLSRLLRELPPETIRLALKGDRLALNCGKVRSTLATLPPDEFPVIDQSGQATVCTLGVASLKKLADRTAFAVSQADSRPTLNGVLLELRADRLRMVATDGQKLVRADEPVSGTDIGDVIVPPAAFEHVARCFADGDVVVSRGESWITFSTDAATVSTRLIEGPFPPYDAAIPKKHKIVATLDRQAVLAAVQRVMVVVAGELFSDGVRRRRMRLAFEDGTVRASGSDQDVGSLDDTLPCELTGEPIELACDPQALAEILRRIESDQVTFRFTGPENAFVIEPVTATRDYLCCLMGLRLN